MNEDNEDEEIRKEKAYWKEKGKKFLRSYRYLNSLTVKKKKKENNHVL